MGDEKNQIYIPSEGIFSSTVLLRMVIADTKLVPVPLSKAGVYDYAGTPDRVWDSSHPIVEHRIEELKRRGMLDKYKGDQQRA